MLQESTLAFFRELRQNNHKEWFDINRKRYDKVKENYLALAGTILEEMKKVDSTLEMLQPKECVFRINKDVRFSKDKAPYKTNLGFIFSPYGKKMGTAGYYLHIEEGQSFIGGGLWMPESHQLAKIRKEIHYFYDDLTQILADPSFIKVYGGLDNDSKIRLVRPPKGYEADNPAIEFLKLKSFTAIRPIEDKIITTSKLVPTVVEIFTALKPLLVFLNRGLMSDDDGGL
jgi:uncharacterized protein (TIGR02453 family)